MEYFPILYVDPWPRLIKFVGSILDGCMISVLVLLKRNGGALADGLVVLGRQ
jgi:hypothetical protein